MVELNSMATGPNKSFFPFLQNCHQNLCVTTTCYYNMLLQRSMWHTQHINIPAAILRRDADGLKCIQGATTLGPETSFYTVTS